MAKFAFTLDLESDIKPVSDFRSHAADTLRQVQESGRPVVLTQRGRSAAVLLSVPAYQAMVDELDELRDVQQGLRDLHTGNVVEHSDARAQLLGEFRE